MRSSELNDSILQLLGTYSRALPHPFLSPYHPPPIPPYGLLLVGGLAVVASLLHVLALAELGTQILLLLLLARLQPMLLPQLLQEAGLIGVLCVGEERERGRGVG